MLKEKVERGRRSNLQKLVWISILDFLSIIVAYGAGLWIRFEFSIDSIPVEYVDVFTTWIWVWCAINFFVFLTIFFY